MGKAPLSYVDTVSTSAVGSYDWSHLKECEELI